jgi:hypothetical protein
MNHPHGPLKIMLYVKAAAAQQTKSMLRNILILMGTPASRTNSINLGMLDLPRSNLHKVDDHFFRGRGFECYSPALANSTQGVSTILMEHSWYFYPRQQRLPLSRILGPSL